jgi:hypothetical protein
LGEKHHGCIAAAADSSDDRRSSAVKILQCKGLLVGDHANLKIDDEPLRILMRL